MNKLAAASAAHFCVDLCCAALFFGYLNASPDWWVCMILYNACAFALQFPLGLLADAWNRNLIFAALGCGLVAVGFFVRFDPRDHRRFIALPVHVLLDEPGHFRHAALSVKTCGA